MKNFTFIPNETYECTVQAWIHTSCTREEITPRLYPAVIICPGGGYENVSDREAEPVAEPYFGAGYNVFILDYSVGENAKNFIPLIQLASTVAKIRENSHAWCTASDQIAVCGFSAGGHLACSLGTLFNDPKFRGSFSFDISVKPNAMILAYPVITSDEYAHVDSIRRVSGCSIGTEEYEWFGLDRHVDIDTPPTFIWHTADDATVPVENSLKLALALSKVNVPYELHVFPYGCHGMSVCTNEVETPCTYNGRWVNFSLEWLGRLFKFDK